MTMSISIAIKIKARNKMHEGFLRHALDKFRGKPAAQRGLGTLRLRSG